MAGRPKKGSAMPLPDFGDAHWQYMIDIGRSEFLLGWKKKMGRSACDKSNWSALNKAHTSAAGPFRGKKSSLEALVSLF